MYKGLKIGTKDCSKSLYGFISKKAELMFRGEALVEANKGKKVNESQSTLPR